MKKRLIFTIIMLCLFSCGILSACDNGDKIYEEVNGISFTAGEIGFTPAHAYVYRVHIHNNSDADKTFVAVDFKIKDNDRKTKNGIRLVENNGHVNDDKIDSFVVKTKSSGVIEIVFEPNDNQTSKSIDYSNGLRLLYMNKAVYQIN